MNPSTTLRPTSFTRRALLGVLTLGSLALATPALAQTAPLPATPVHITQPSPASVRLRIDNPARQRGRVELVHQGTGQPLFAESYSDVAYGHRFNFDTLPTGTYVMKLKVGPDRYSYTLQVGATKQGATVAISELAPAAPALASSAK